MTRRSDSSGEPTIWPSGIIDLRGIVLRTTMMKKGPGIAYVVSEKHHISIYKVWDGERH